MSPSMHPPCVPSASCTPVRCHPTPPPCQNPEKCLKKTISKGIRPCLSAVSILAVRSKARCATCGKFQTKNKDPRKVSNVTKFLKEKSKVTKMKKRDRLKGSHSYLEYTRKKGSIRDSTDCCAGHGHRGRLKKKYRKCEIL